MLDPEARKLAQEKNFAALTTLLPSGQPMTHMMWVDADDDHVLVNTEVNRQKFKNIKADPRVTVTVIDSNSPYHYAEIRGRVVNTDSSERARLHIDTLSELYNGAPYDASMITSDRVILEIEPERVRVFG